MKTTANDKVIKKTRGAVYSKEAGDTLTTWTEKPA